MGFCFCGLDFKAEFKADPVPNLSRFTVLYVQLVFVCVRIGLVFSHLFEFTVSCESVWEGSSLLRHMMVNHLVSGACLVYHTFGSYLHLLINPCWKAEEWRGGGGGGGLCFFFFFVFFSLVPPSLPLLIFYFYLPIFLSIFLLLHHFSI